MRRWLTLCALVVVLLVANVLRYRLARDGERHGQFTANQILDLTEYVCGRLAPDAGSLRLAPDAVTVPSPGCLHRYWSIDCMSDAGEEDTYMQWDAQTGRIVRMSRCSLGPATLRGRPIDAQDAVAASRDVLQALGPFTAATRWRLAGPARFAARRWKVFWGDPASVAIVTLDGNGRMQTVEFFRPPASRWPPPG